MKKKLIVANWKLNPTSQREAERLFESIRKGVEKIKNAETVICPPFIYLLLFNGLSLGAQDVFCENEGAFTGEISPEMLKNAGVKYAIIGHSERRKHFKETDEIINKKIKKSLNVGLKPIFCIGENTGENKTVVLENQIEKGLEGVSAKDFVKIIIAYEPVWAIGTGHNCSIDATMGSILLIKKMILRLYGKKSASAVRVIYGGSVDGENAGLYLKETGADGLLVGSASLNAEEFMKIVMVAS